MRSGSFGGDGRIHSAEPSGSFNVAVGGLSNQVGIRGTANGATVNRAVASDLLAMGSAAPGLQCRKVAGMAAATSSAPSSVIAPLYDEAADVWMYIDPSGRQQGPCSILQFRIWLRNLVKDENLPGEYEKFLSCAVWRQLPSGNDWLAGENSSGSLRTTVSELLRKLP